MKIHLSLEHAYRTIADFGPQFSGSVLYREAGDLRVVTIRGNGASDVSLEQLRREDFYRRLIA